jgi:hypothetical protein
MSVCELFSEVGHGKALRSSVFHSTTKYSIILLSLSLCLCVMDDDSTATGRRAV